jgi:hypothetical protein
LCCVEGVGGTMLRNNNNNAYPIMEEFGSSSQLSPLFPASPQRLCSHGLMIFRILLHFSL